MKKGSLLIRQMSELKERLPDAVHLIHCRGYGRQRQRREIAKDSAYPLIITEPNIISTAARVSRYFERHHNYQIYTCIVIDDIEGVDGRDIYA